MKDSLWKRWKVGGTAIWMGMVMSVPLCGRADTAVGDWGHFVEHRPRIYLNNPDGKDFTFTLHIMRWAVTNWNAPKVKILLTGPDGKAIVSGEREVPDAECTVSVNAGLKGVYRLEPEGQPFWVSSTLDEAVLWTGDPHGEHVFRDRLAPVFQASVPRHWWFWVPDGTTNFTCKAQRSSEYMSQREDWGIFIITPRGQRIRALWGQPPHTPPADTGRTWCCRSKSSPEPAAGSGRWRCGWGIRITISKPNICFEGIPPYIARSPEEWFNPETGQKPPVKVYDDDPFIQSARIDPLMKERWPNLQHFSPCPSLGDPDGIEVLGDASFALWNPEDRELRFRIGTYLPRKDAKNPEMAQVNIAGPAGKTLFDKALPMLHVHGEGGQPTDVLHTGKGVSTVRVTGVERWLSFTYPATPLVLLGQDAENGWKRFRFSAGTVRNWYFWVPKGPGISPCARPPKTRPIS